MPDNQQVDEYAEWKDKVMKDFTKIKQFIFKDQYNDLYATLIELLDQCNAAVRESEGLPSVEETPETEET